jgi:hypothetical protein
MALRFHWFLPTNGDGRDIVRIEEYASLGISAQAGTASKVAP